ncbi:permease [Agreia sp. Leaf244]|uniref:permease n=1 Tax=Agreia sp. Leaf244 TaxID=1736305 RepID=UPI0009E93005|nr:permease [Agreia sp. Leaf244]
MRQSRHEERTLSTTPTTYPSLRELTRSEWRWTPTVGVAAVLLLVAIRALAPAEWTSWMTDPAKDFVTLSVSVIIESLPFVILGILLSAIMQIWLPAGFLVRRLPRNAVLRRSLISLLGVLLPICECGNVPLTRGLIVSGLSVADSMAFLFAAPIINPITIITTYQAFGWNDGILISRVLGGLFIANLVGFIYSAHPAPQTLLTRGFQAACAADAHGEQRTRTRRTLVSFGRESAAMMPALIVGAGIAGFIQVAVSRNLLITLGSNPLWSVLALMALAFIVAICSNVDAFFILSFGSTFLPGGIVAFLIFGPMIDIKMLALMRTTFTVRTLVQVSVLIAVCAAAIGLAVNLVF